MRCPPDTSVVLTGYSARTGYLRDAGGDAERDEREEQDDELAGGERADEARVRRHRLRADVRDDVGRVEQNGERLHNVYSHIYLHLYI